MLNIFMIVISALAVPTGSYISPVCLDKANLDIQNKVNIFCMVCKSIGITENLNN